MYEGICKTDAKLQSCQAACKQPGDGGQPCSSAATNGLCLLQASALYAECRLPLVDDAHGRNEMKTLDTFRCSSSGEQHTHACGMHTCKQGKLQVGHCPVKGVPQARQGVGCTLRGWIGLWRLLQPAAAPAPWPETQPLSYAHTSIWLSLPKQLAGTRQHLQLRRGRASLWDNSCHLAERDQLDLGGLID